MVYCSIKVSRFVNASTVTSSSASMFRRGNRRQSSDTSTMGFLDIVPAPLVDPDIKSAYMYGILVESRIARCGKE
ncbi:hypothetical protein [Barnesiella intestinihominis]|uniref:hypothetical protein n=1 Tax=Barnesiella intestinihominis TaxID=487174 RepID=UPI003AB78328